MKKRPKCRFCYIATLRIFRHADARANVGGMGKILDAPHTKNATLLHCYIATLRIFHIAPSKSQSKVILLYIL